MSSKAIALEVKACTGTPVRLPVVLDCSHSPSMTKQSFREECNINKIIAKYQKTGLVTHLARYSPQYAEVPSIDFREALEIVSEGKKMFESLPSNIRKKFNQSPAEFLEFVQDSTNQDELVSLGLATKKAEPAAEKKAAPSASAA